MLFAWCYQLCIILPKIWHTYATWLLHIYVTFSNVTTLKNQNSNSVKRGNSSEKKGEATLLKCDSIVLFTRLDIGQSWMCFDGEYYTILRTVLKGCTYTSWMCCLKDKSKTNLIEVNEFPLTWVWIGRQWCIPNSQLLFFRFKWFISSNIVHLFPHQRNGLNSAFTSSTFLIH